MIAVRRQFHFSRGRNGSLRLVDGTKPEPSPPPLRVPRISRLMALAIHYDRLIREGTVRDQTGLAHQLGITQPRMTQIFNLLHLSPEIQETLLTLPKVQSGREPISERHLRHICATNCWSKQIALWKNLSI
jgi:hypothetical protein